MRLGNVHAGPQQRTCTRLQGRTGLSETNAPLPLLSIRLELPEDPSVGDMLGCLQ